MHKGWKFQLESLRLCGSACISCTHTVLIIPLHQALRSHSQALKSEYLPNHQVCLVSTAAYVAKFYLVRIIFSHTTIEALQLRFALCKLLATIPLILYKVFTYSTRKTKFSNPVQLFTSSSQVTLYDFSL